MNPRTLWVPFSVLNGATHSANTRLVWLLQAHRAPAPAAAPVGRSKPADLRLRQLSGLDPQTITAARTRLTRAPLEPCSGTPRPACAAIPWPLLTNADLSAGARLLYGQLQGVPNFEHPDGCFTYASLSRLTGSSDDALRRATAELVASGWLTIAQVNRKSPLNFTLRDPVSPLLRARISSLRRRVRNAPYRGEALLREFLNLLIAVDEYTDNATLDFLLNPFTKELLELDRYYPAFGVGIELNGAQHYELTAVATYAETVKQVGRDAMKAFICRAQGVDLVIIHPEDLQMKVLDQKLPAHLPRRAIEAQQQPLADALEELAAEYRQRTCAERAQSRKSLTRDHA